MIKNIFNSYFVVMLLSMVICSSCFSMESKESYVVKTDFLQEIIQSPKTKHLHNYYPELTYLILKGDGLGYQAGFKIFIYMHKSGCCSSDVATKIMNENLAQFLSWGEDDFWNAIRLLDPKEMVIVLDIYEKHYSKYMPPDYDEEKKKLYMEFGIK